MKHPLSFFVLVLVAGCAHAAGSESHTAIGPDRSRNVAAPSSLAPEAIRAGAPRSMIERGISGYAMVSVTISREGTLMSAVVREESPPGVGIGDACAATFRSHARGWQPALDASGRPMSVRVTMYCRYDVRAFEPPLASSDPAAAVPCSPPPEPESTETMLVFGTPCEAPSATEAQHQVTRRPVPPRGLSTEGLAAHYPQQARALRVEGSAVVRIAVSATGEVTAVAVRSESHRELGFGAACEAFIRTHERGWEPALDAEGRPMPYAFNFRCAFQLNDR